MSADLPALQSQLASLERQKTLLTTQLLSLRAARPLSSTSPAPAAPASTPSATPTPQPSPPAQLTDDQLLSQVLSSTTQKTASLTRLHRITGITTFPVRDPSPPHEKLLGIRIEIFADRTPSPPPPHIGAHLTPTGKFHTPHYLLLSFPPESAKSPGTFTIHRHTLPPYLPLQRLNKTHAHSLPAFVRALRRTLLLHARRVAAVKRLKTLALAAGDGGVEGVEWDAEVALVTVSWANGTKGWIKVGEEGTVGKVVVKDGKGGRETEVERRIVGALEGVAGRMGWEGGVVTA